jgi:hypothetical protein
MVFQSFESAGDNVSIRPVLDYFFPGTIKRTDSCDEVKSGSSLPKTEANASLSVKASTTQVLDVMSGLRSPRSNVKILDGFQASRSRAGLPYRAAGLGDTVAVKRFEGEIEGSDQVTPFHGQVPMTAALEMVRAGMSEEAAASALNIKDDDFVARLKNNSAAERRNNLHYELGNLEHEIRFGRGSEKKIFDKQTAGLPASQVAELDKIRKDVENSGGPRLSAHAKEWIIASMEKSPKGQKLEDFLASGPWQGFGYPLGHEDDLKVLRKEFEKAQASAHGDLEGAWNKVAPAFGILRREIDAMYAHVPDQKDKKIMSDRAIEELKSILKVLRDHR